VSVVGSGIAAQRLSPTDVGLQLFENTAATAGAPAAAEPTQAPEGKAQVNRKDFGVTFNAPLETGGVLVGDKITLEFDVSLIRS